MLLRGYKQHIKRNDFFLLGIRETAYASSKELTYMCSTSKYGSFQSVKLIIENAIIIIGHVHVLRCHLDPPYQRLNRIIHMKVTSVFFCIYHHKRKSHHLCS